VTRHWDADHVVSTLLEELAGQSNALLTEDECVAEFELGIEVAHPSMPAEQPGARLPGWAERRDALLGRAQRFVLNHFYEVPIVESGAPHGVLVDPKTEPSNQMKRAARRRTQAGDIARIRGNFGLYQDNVEGPLDGARA